MSRLAAPALVACIALAATPRPCSADASSPFGLAARLESRIAAGDGIALPDAALEFVRYAGTVDLADGDWPVEFLARAGGTVCVAVSPFTGCYEFFDESGDVFWTVVPVLPTTDNWVAPFRHAEGGTHPDGDLYAPWRLVDVWHLTHTGFGESSEFDSRAENAESAESLVTRHSSLVTRGAACPATNLCFTAFSFSETNLCFTAAWPTNEPPPESVLDLYVSTNLSSRWSLHASHPATNPPVSFSVGRASVPGYVAPAVHVHDATCESITNVVASPLDGTTVYTNVLWSCATNRAPAETAFFRLGTRHDTDGDGLTDAAELLVHGTRPDRLDSDGDGVPDGVEPSLWWSNPLWATNAEDADFIVDLVAPADGSAETILTMDGLRIPLSPNAGPWAFRLPRGRAVPCSASSSGSFFVLWCGAPGGSFWDPAPVFEKPLWTDGIDNISGYHTEGGSCLLAVPELTIEPDFGPADPTNSVAGTGSHWTESGSVCVHEADGILQYSWDVAPAIVGQGRQPIVTGPLRFDSTGLYADVSATTGEQEGTFVLADGLRSSAGSLHSPISTNVVVHRCTATQQDPYCSVCGRYEGNDLAVSVYGASGRTLTLKHDNTAVFLLDHPSSSDEVFQSTHFEIMQDGLTGWTPLNGAVWIARIAGRFHVRAVVETDDGRTVPSGISPLVVRFPSEAEMIADPDVAAHATNLWEQMLSLCTPTSRLEVGCWIQLDTSTDTYLFTTNQYGPPTPNNAVSSIELLPLPSDTPALPTLLDQSAIYTVATLHTHTPAMHITEPNRPVGPSEADERASRQLKLPGLVCDYDALLPPDYDAPNGRIPTGHPTNATWRVFPTGVQPRREYPWTFLQ